VSNCVFCRILAREIPAHVILDTPACLAFLDVGPLSEGHLLAIPRRHVERLDQLSEDEAAGLARLLPRLSRAVLGATGAPGLNILQNNGSEAGQVVPHVHFHLIPRRANDGLGYRWNAGRYSAGRVEAVRDALLNALRNDP